VAEGLITSITADRSVFANYAKPAITVGPYISGVVSVQEKSALVSETLLLCDTGELVTGFSKEMMSGTNPQIGLAIFSQAKTVVLHKLPGVQAIEGRECFTVEPRQSVRRGSPQIPVACLQNGGDPVIRQPILMGPDPLIVLSCDFGL
jgi:hypothetical protein